MPIIARKASQSETKKGERMSPEQELMLISGWGKCHKRLERLLSDRRPNINYKNDDGLTALHNACICGSSEFVRKLLDAEADPNVPATSTLGTPLDVVVSKISYEEERHVRLNGFDQVNRLDDTSIAVRVDLSGWKQCKEILEAAGAVQGKCLEDDPSVKPDGSVNDGPPSELRSYTRTKDGTYTASHHLRSGKFDVLKYENGMLVQADYDKKTGHWDIGDGLTCKDADKENTTRDTSEKNQK